jgi:phage gp16-like protein
MTPLSKPSTASKDRVNAQRKGLYGKIKIACKQLGIADEDYRALLATRYAGKTSSTKLSLAELEDLIGYFKAQGWTPTKSRAPTRAGSRKLADGVEAAKARALWISLYHLGVVRNPAEAALADFVKRQTGVRALEWVRDWEPVIEALKKMAEREADVDWSGYQVFIDGMWQVDYRPRQRVIEAQWRILVNAGTAEKGQVAVDIAHMLGIQPHQLEFLLCADHQLDQVIEELGPRVRAARRVAS